MSAACSLFWHQTTCSTALSNLLGARMHYIAPLRTVMHAWHYPTARCLTLPLFPGPGLLLACCGVLHDPRPAVLFRKTQEGIRAERCSKSGCGCVRLHLHVWSRAIFSFQHGSSRWHCHLTTFCTVLVWGLSRRQVWPCSCGGTTMSILSIPQQQVVVVATACKSAILWPVRSHRAGEGLPLLP